MDEVTELKNELARVKEKLESTELILVLIFSRKQPMKFKLLYIPRIEQKWTN